MLKNRKSSDIREATWAILATAKNTENHDIVNPSIEGRSDVIVVLQVWQIRESWSDFSNTIFGRKKAPQLN